MVSSEKDSSIPIRILSYLKEFPHGANILDISDSLGIGRNLVARYLKNLTQTGRLDLRTIGNNKVYRITHRIPFHVFSIYPDVGVIGFNRSLQVHEVSDYILKIQCPY